MNVSYLLPLILLSSCLSTQLSQKQLDIVQKYKNADKSKSCATFKDLKEDSHFPLKELINLKMIQHCPLSAKDFRSAWEQDFSTRPYIKKELLKSAYAYAKERNLDQDLILIGLAYGHMPKIKKEREEIAKLIKTKALKLKIPSLIKATQENLDDIAPRYIQKPEQDQLMMVAKDFEKVRDFKKARKYYEKVIKDKKQLPQDRMKAYFRKAMSYKLKRDKVTYSKVLSQMTRWIDRTKISHEQVEMAEDEKSLLDLAWDYKLKSVRALWTIGERDRAEKQLKSFLKARNIPSPTMGEANLYLGLIEQEKKNYAQANVYLERALGNPNLPEDLLEKISWNLAWGYYIAGQYNKALQVFDKALAEIENENVKKKYLFWKAKSLIHLKKESIARDIWQNMTRSHSYNYYTILAHLELGKTLPPIQFKGYPPQNTKSETLRWLKALEEDKLTKSFLKSQDNHHDYPDYHFAGWYDGGIFEFFSLIKEEEKRDFIYEKHLPLGFPTPNLGITTKVAQQTGVPQAFIYAIARQESAFNEHARSWADAFGLLQVTPEKAKQISRRHKLNYNQKEDLYIPELNMRIGSLLLKKLADQVDRNFMALVSSYNAGKSPYKRWRKQRYRQDPLEFIEMVPYKETRNYIKLVFRNYVTYKRLTGEEVSISPDFFNRAFF